MNREYEEYLLTTTPEERKKLRENGLEVDSRGTRVQREATDKSVTQIQHEKLEKLMQRADVPLEEDPREWTEYRAPRKMGPSLQLPGQEERTGNDYHSFRTINKKAAIKKLLDDDQLKLEQRREQEQEQRRAATKRAKEITEKKRAKRLKRKANRIFTPGPNPNLDNPQNLDNPNLDNPQSNSQSNANQNQ